METNLIPTRGKGHSKSVLLTVRATYPSLYSAEQKVADMVLNHPEKVLDSSITRIAEEAGVAESTIVRFCQSIGLEGFREFRIALAQDLAPSVQLIHKDILPGDDANAITEKVFYADIQGLQDTLKILDKDEMQKAINAILSARRIEFFGVGGSSPIADEAYHRFIRIGLPSRFVGDSHAQIVVAMSLGKGDVVVGISHSGQTESIVKAIRTAREQGVTTIGITNYIKSPLAQTADIKLLTAFREIAYRNENMAARVAQLAIIDALCVNVAARMKDKALKALERLQQLLE